MDKKQNEKDAVHFLKNVKYIHGFSVIFHVENHCKDLPFKLK